VFCPFLSTVHRCCSFANVKIFELTVFTPLHYSTFAGKIECFFADAKEAASGGLLSPDAAVYFVLGGIRENEMERKED
jgi:hypothetical protein